LVLRGGEWAADRVASGCGAERGATGCWDCVLGRVRVAVFYRSGEVGGAVGGVFAYLPGVAYVLPEAAPDARGGPGVGGVFSQGLWGGAFGSGAGGRCEPGLILEWARAL